MNQDITFIIIVLFCSIFVGIFYNPLNLLTGNENQNSSLKSNNCNFGSPDLCKDELASFSFSKNGDKCPISGEQDNFCKSTQVAWKQYNYPYRKQDFVVVPSTIEEVQKTLQCASKNNINVVVKSGGHDYAGFSQVTEDDISKFSISMENFNQIRQITYSGSACDSCQAMEIGSGARFEDVYYELNKTNEYILAGGLCPSVGAIPFHLGGGLGATNRLWGLGVDNMLSVSLVTYDGSQYITVSEDSESESERELFWALRGGGGTTFGVITSITVKLHKLSDHYEPLNIPTTFVYGEYCIGEDDEENMIFEFGQFLKNAHNTPNWLTIDWRLVYHTNLTESDTEHRELCFLIYSMNSIANTRKSLTSLFHWREEDVGSEENLPVSAPPYGARMWMDDRIPIKEGLIGEIYNPHYNFLNASDNFLAMDISNAIYKGYRPVSNYITHDWNWIVSDISDNMIVDIVKYFMSIKNCTTCGIQGMTIGVNSTKSSDYTAFPFRKPVQFVADAECEVNGISDDECLKFVTGYVDLIQKYADGAYYNFPYRKLVNYENNYWTTNLEKLKKIRSKWNPKECYPLKFEQEIPLIKN